MARASPAKTRQDAGSIPDHTAMPSDPEQPWDWFGGEGLQLPSRLDEERLAPYLAAADERLHRMALVVEAMRELLQEAGLFRQADLMARMQSIDLRDGVADSRQGSAPHQHLCGNCGRTFNRRLQRCLYCGSQDLRPKP